MNVTAEEREKSHGLAAIWHILGQDRLHDKYQTRLEAHDYLVTHGLPFTAIKSLSGVIRVDLYKDGEEVFGLGGKTIQRRALKHRLPTEEATMVFRFAEVVLQAIDAFDDREKAVRWMRKPCRALNNKIPLFLLHDDVGRGLVEDLLGQIKYGLYS